MEKLGEFLGKYAGMIIGALIGIIIITTKLVAVVFNLVVIAACAYVGKYIQQNGGEVKKKIKNLIEKW